MGADLNRDVDPEELTFRPRTYCRPESSTDRLLHRIQGAQRRRRARRLIEQGRIDELEPIFAEAEPSPAERPAFGALHPACMGGEYLPAMEPGKVEIARTTVASATQGVTRVCARLDGDWIAYRVVDEYGGATLRPPEDGTPKPPLAGLRTTGPPMAASGSR